MRHRRANTAEATYFFTVNLADRKSNLLTDNIEKLRQALRTIRQSHPFEIIAMVVLPDRLHAEIGWDVRMKNNDIYRRDENESWFE